MGYDKKSFELTNKINDMIKYSNPIILSFNRKYRKLGNKIFDVTHELRDLSISVGNHHDDRKNIQLMDDKLDILRSLLKEACEPDFYKLGELPPLSIHQWEVWSVKVNEIGRIIGGVLRSHQYGK